MGWLHDNFGPLGAILFQILVPIFVVGALFVCFCSILLTCMHSLIQCYVGQMVGQYTLVPHDDPIHLSLSLPFSDYDTTTDNTDVCCDAVL